ILRSDPEPWAIEDSLLVAYAMFLELNDERATQDVRRGFAHHALPDTLFNWMYPAGTAWDAPLTGEPKHINALPNADSVDLRETHIVFSDTAVDDGEKNLVPGSNNWAVAGKLTNNGRSIVANDMHLSITTPNIFYRARLVQHGAQARDVSGVTLPGTPVVVAGSNGRIAWGFTNSYGDWTDAVLLQPGTIPDTYRTPDGIKAIAASREQIIVKGADLDELLVRETIWGPILDDIKHPDGEIAVSWIAHYPEAVNITQLELETASSVEEAIAIANRMGIPPQNFVAGDEAGNIAWTIAGKIPRRGDAAALLPADWSEGAGWRGWLTPDEYPRIINPANGRIWTANARVADGADLNKIGDGGYDLGARAVQIRDALLDHDTFTPTDMLHIQLDDRALFLARWRILLLKLLDDDATRDHPARAEYRRLVSSWVPRASVDSVGYRLVRAFRTDVRNRTFHMLTTPVRAAFGDDLHLRISKQFEGPLWQLVTE
ncbi:MAG: penicillin acylase family protein, partial [Gammaproteobacteria bacterium]|nr:penicillin acylase family protein [Gammaproteobacteria bacterium]